MADGRPVSRQTDAHAPLSAYLIGSKCSLTIRTMIDDRGWALAEFAFLLLVVVL